jgi:Fe-S oxidoreductase
MTVRDQEPLLEVTDAIAEHGGAALLECLGCGTCSVSCPWTLVRDHSVRRIVRLAALGLEGFEPQSWLCLTCNLCVERCPQQIDLVEVMQAMRAVAAEAGGLPRGLSAAVGSLASAGNPWGGDQNERSQWARGIEHEDREREGEGEGEREQLLYFNCCTSAYDGRAQKLARAAVVLLRHAGFDVAFAAEGEICCGDLAVRAGRSDLAERLMAKNLSAFSAAGGAPVVTSSPHCRQAFRGPYADRDAAVGQARHTCEVLAGAVSSGALRLTRAVRARAAFHDPCYLGRHAGIFELPRDLLRAVPELELVELPRNREDALCCGGGGGGAFRETATDERHALLRVDEARAAKVDLLVTACPLCLLMLEDAVRVRDLEGSLRVLDLCEVLKQGLGNDE